LAPRAYPSRGPHTSDTRPAAKNKEFSAERRPASRLDLAETLPSSKISEISEIQDAEDPAERRADLLQPPLGDRAASHVGMDLPKAMRLPASPPG
jgi:hypothetical protein